MQISVRVPCSTSNLGSGFDCVGLAFNRYLTATLTVTAAPLQIERRGTLTDLADAADDLVVAAMRQLQYEPRGELVLDSDIPVGRGLGSSAAATVAGVMLAAHVRGQPLDRDTVAAHATAIEGHPDNAVPAIYGGLMAAILDQASEITKVRVHRLPLSNALRFVYAAPDAIVSTRAARQALPESVPHRTAVGAIARSIALLQGLADGDPELLRIGCSDELHVPYRLPMIPGGQAAQQAALDAGAFAATISGSGSGMIAVCGVNTEGVVLDAMRTAFERATAAEAIAFVAATDEKGAQMMNVSA